jgi:hypothetical protein
VVGSCEHGNKFSGSINVLLSDYYLLSTLVHVVKSVMRYLELFS